MGARAFTHRGHGHGAYKRGVCVTDTPRKNPLYNIRGFYFTAISGLGRFGGGGVLASDFDHQNHVVHLGLGRASWQGAQGHCPHHFDGLSARPGAPVSRRSPRSRAVRGPRAGFLEVGTGVGREPVTAEDCGSDCGSGVSNWARTPTGFESTRQSTTSRIMGVLGVEACFKYRCVGSASSWT